MTAPAANHARGLTLTAIGGLTLTADIPLIKLADGDVWSILFLRAASTLTVALLVWLAWRRFGRNAPPLVPGLPGLAVAGFYAMTSICFITAIYHTSTANLVFIVAFSPMFATALAWGLVGERPRPATLVAMLAMVAGVGIIVGDGIGSGTVFGDMLALLTAFGLACAITITRASGRDMGFTALVAVCVPMAIAAVFVVQQGGLQVTTPAWIVFNGAVVMPIAFFCLATGPKYISGPEVAMFYLLETVLAPIWVWLIFAEAPGTAALIGGTILVTALVAHSLWQLREARRRRAAARAVRHPP